ncbi:MAG: hypothetical protein ACLPZR_33860 [Solirubrobacteraceae bacterium]
MNEQQQLLASVEPVMELELVDGTVAEEPTDVAVIAAPSPAGLEGRNLFGEAQRIAAARRVPSRSPPRRSRGRPRRSPTRAPSSTPSTPGDFAAPAAGWYAVGCSVSATLGAG